jgi:hypothetical protein
MSAFWAEAWRFLTTLTAIFTPAMTSKSQGAQSEASFSSYSPSSSFSFAQFGPTSAFQLLELLSNEQRQLLLKLQTESFLIHDDVIIRCLFLLHQLSEDKKKKNEELGVFSLQYKALFKRELQCEVTTSSSLHLPWFCKAQVLLHNSFFLLHFGIERELRQSL